MDRRNRPKKKKVSRKVQLAEQKQQERKAARRQVKTETKTVEVEIPQIITVGELASRSGIPAVKIIEVLIKNGIIATINDSVDKETIEIVAPELGIITKNPSDSDEKEAKAEIRDKNLPPRPPVVTILGHVDHGKTTLLDKIRQTNVAGGESGGITQHIGAYQIDHKTEKGETRAITFLDTPGHAAFSALRAHGASVTDIAILVVAADDGVKEQTKEALSHAKAANVPIIVALNKIDKPDANADKVKGQLAEIGLTPEDWGGKVPVVGVSAKEGTGISDLLDVVLLVADLADLRAPNEGLGRGVVIDSHKEQGLGPVATVLVQEGEFKVGDAIVIEGGSGKIRFMENEYGKRLKRAVPSMPIKVVGLTEIAPFGSNIIIAPNDREARLLAQQARIHSGAHLARSAGAFGEDLTLPLIVRADVTGSLKALEAALVAIKADRVQTKVIHTGIGNITESDVNMAVSSGATLVAFRVDLPASARNLAQANGIRLISDEVIYKIIEEVEKLAKSLKEIKIVEVELGRLKVLKVFHSTRNSQIVGGKVEEGEIQNHKPVKIMREGEEVGTADINTLKLGQKDTQSVESGNEAGLGLKIGSQKVLEDDVLVCMGEEEV